MSDEPSEQPAIQIDEVTYLRRVIARLTARAESAEDAADKFAALSDMMAAEVSNLKETNKSLADTLAAMQQDARDAAPSPRTAIDHSEG